MKRTKIINSKIIRLFELHNGYCRMKELKESSIHPRDIRTCLEAGIIEKIKPGLYKLTDFPWDERSGFADIYAANPNAVVCLDSAAEYYGFITFTPAEISVAIPHGAYKMKFEYPPVKTYFFRGRYFEEGIVTKNRSNGAFKIYSEEKTIIDLFRYRNKIGEDFFFEALKKYLSMHHGDISKFLSIADKFNLREKLLPFVKAMVA